MNPFHWSFRSQFLLGFAICAALLGYAFYVQFQLGIEPCPFCIFQRIAFAALGLVFLLGGLHAPRAPGGRKAWSLLAFVAAAVGAGYAGRHSWVQLNPPAMPSCGNGPMPKISSGQSTMLRPFDSHSTRIAMAASPAPRKIALITNSSMITALPPSIHCV